MEELRVEADTLVKNDRNSYLIKATCSPMCYRHEVDSLDVCKWLMRNARGLNSSWWLGTRRWPFRDLETTWGKRNKFLKRLNCVVKADYYKMQVPQYVMNNKWIQDYCGCSYNKNSLSLLRAYDVLGTIISSSTYINLLIFLYDLFI